ncbi:UNVERIFIED_CONTAM: hypothetical protein Sradi_4058600 [Sesamum radiatum]|uniref:CCHC-type domain-containing protein n=1 Tax=Sesamum radiatum TaxID=300843 RepID=A0AAW2PIQ7_SESRA
MPQMKEEKGQGRRSRNRLQHTIGRDHALSNAQIYLRENGQLGKICCCDLFPSPYGKLEGKREDEFSATKGFPRDSTWFHYCYSCRIRQILATKVCGNCSIPGHPENACPSLQHNLIWETNAVRGFSSYDFYSESYNPEWQSNFNYWDQKEQLRYQPPPSLTQVAPQTPISDMSLEDIVKSLALQTSSYQSQMGQSTHQPQESYPTPNSDLSLEDIVIRIRKQICRKQRMPKSKEDENESLNTSLKGVITLYPELKSAFYLVPQQITLSDKACSRLISPSVLSAPFSNAAPLAI